jgi:outer membrane receptor for ferrienterochelin and colicins
MRNHQLLSSAIFILGTSMCAQATAQAVDYDSLQHLFNEPVTTSATGKPQRASDVSLSMTILTADDIRRTGANTIAEAIQNVPELISWQSSRTNFDINVRGYNQVLSSHLLVLINGRQVYLDHYGLTAWDTIPVQLDEIRQIEIVKGPNTALFGFNATSGVVNIVTKNPLYDSGSSAKYTYGTGDYSQADIVHSFKVGEKTGVRVSGSHKIANDFDQGYNGADNYPTFVKPLRNAANLDSITQLTDRSQLRVEASLSNVEENMILPFGATYLVPYETKSMRSEYQLDSSAGLIKANIYKNWVAVDEITGTGVHMKNDVTIAQLEDTYRLNKNHTLRGTLEHRVNQLTGSNVGTAAKVWYDVSSASGMWDWQLTDNIDVTNAARVDRLSLHRSGPFLALNPQTNDDYDQTNDYYSYNSGIAWKETPHDTLRASTARGVELPSLYEYSMNFTLGPVALVGNPRAKPLMLTHYETAWDHNFESLPLSSTLTYFHQHLGDVKYAALTTDNVGTSDSNGVTIALKGKQPSDFRWDVSYTYQTIQDDFNVPFRNYTDANPQHLAKAHAGYTLDKWDFDGYATYVSATSNFDTTGLFLAAMRPFDSYITTSARIGYDITDDTTIALAGQNLQASTTSQNSGFDVERTVYLSVEKKF